MSTLRLLAAGRVLSGSSPELSWKVPDNLNPSSSTIPTTRFVVWMSFGGEECFSGSSSVPRMLCQQ